MAKVNLSVTRTLTINTGNYESIKPSVSLTVTDVDADNVGDAYLAVEEALTGLIKMEILNCASDGKKVSEGIDRYCRDVNSNMAEIGANVEKSLHELNKF
jgi:hypothetical protein